MSLFSHVLETLKKPKPQNQKKIPTQTKKPILMSNLMVSSKTVFFPKLLQAWKPQIFLSHLRWIKSRQGHFMHSKSFQLKDFHKYQMRCHPARHPAEQECCPATVAAHSEWEGSILGVKLESTLRKKSSVSSGAMSCPLYTSSLWEPVYGNKVELLLVVGIDLEESFHWSLGNSQPKKYVPQLL